MEKPFQSLRKGRVLEWRAAAVVLGQEEVSKEKFSSVTKDICNAQTEEKLRNRLSPPPLVMQKLQFAQGIYGEMERSAIVLRCVLPQASESDDDASSFLRGRSETELLPPSTYDDGFPALSVRFTKSRRSR